MTSTAANVQLVDESSLSNSVEKNVRAEWEPRVVRMTPVERAISTAADWRKERDDSEVATRDGRDTTRVEPNDSQEKAHSESALTQSEQPPQQTAAEEQAATNGERAQDAASKSAQVIEAERNISPVADSIDTKSKPLEESSRDSVDFLMHDFMNSQPPPPPPEEVTWDIKIEPRPLPKSSRIARFATITTLMVSLLGIGGFIAYNKLVVPTPVALGMASGNVELPEPIHLVDINRDQNSKHKSLKRAGVNAPSKPQAAQAQLSKPSESSQIVPEITSNTTAVASSETPADDRSSEIASTAQPAPQSEAKSGNNDDFNESTASQRTGADQRANRRETSSDGPTQTHTEKTYRQALEKAAALHKRSQRAKAKKEYQRALEINPKGAEALGKLAFYSLEESEYTEAIELAERATRIDPTSSEGWIVLGAARQATADRKGAMLAYRKCSESTGQYVKECRRLLR